MEMLAVAVGVLFRSFFSSASGTEPDEAVLFIAPGRVRSALRSNTRMTRAWLAVTVKLQGIDPAAVFHGILCDA